MYAGIRQKIETLFHAAAGGDLPLVEAILSEGNHDVNGLNHWQTDIDPRGWRRTPLHLAALGGHLALARYLLDHGAQVDPRTKYNDTPLHFASAHGHADVVQLLIGRGADLTSKDSDDKTALTLATQYKKAEVVAVLERAQGGVAP